MATIRYTLDGSDPSPTHGFIYTGPFTLPAVTEETVITVKAIVYGDELEDSEITEVIFTFTSAEEPEPEEPETDGECFDTICLVAEDVVPTCVVPLNPTTVCLTIPSAQSVICAEASPATQQCGNDRLERECPEGSTGELLVIEANTYFAENTAAANVLAQAALDALSLAQPCSLTATVTVYESYREGELSLIGCQEYSPSAVARFYKRREINGTFQSYWSGSFVDGCDVVPMVLLDTSITNSWLQYDENGDTTSGGTNTFNGVPFPVDENCAHPANDENCSGAVPPGTGDITQGELISPVRFDWVAHREFCCVRRTILGSVLYSIEYDGVKSWTLSDEDTEDMAISRFRTANPYSEFTEVINFSGINETPFTAGVTTYEQRTTGRTFDYRESRVRIDITELNPGTSYDISAEIRRTDLSTMIETIVASYDFSDVADLSGEITDTFNVPVLAGYYYRVSNVSIDFSP